MDGEEIKDFLFQITKYYLNHFKEYAINLAKQLGVKQIQRDPKNLGKDLKPEALDQFRDEQIVQLHELFKASKGIDDENEKK